MEKIRTFIAHPVPQQWKEILSAASAPLKLGLASRVAWVKPENMHFTLKFLGDVPADRIQEIHTALQKIPFAPFEITAGRSGFFPEQAKPRIIWLGLSRGADELCRNGAAIDLKLAELNFEKNQKPCHAHLTLGRIKKQAKDDWSALAERINQIKLPPAKVTSFTLYQSTLTPIGPIYSAIYKYGE
ncbi:RNA 2',3'-cyclic phosphodiesterase [Maridesulfovibrio hydrothermalis]|uniref:RNA 2',3'-cyclic phosphodiesterase n=1 Tax=Maridesulfovibrio hydrothermalis AM13 = DSM 14728 TaxID=1121451 RepID=L0RAT2_9BACT|nr:RNA 2',3'-cyclic phosphodiesterase [Maridesulfovibrio hydrothermalis]CCO22681.1 2'-5' RNA ligase [Maridesulfovibrio hydrothermalis AM13 = DSM 14728]